MTNPTHPAAVGWSPAHCGAEVSEAAAIALQAATDGRLGGHFVQGHVDGVARLRNIGITTDYGTEVEVNDGVKDGDKVILQPPVNLSDGDKVQAVPEAQTPTP